MGRGPKDKAGELRQEGSAACVKVSDGLAVLVCQETTRKSTAFRWDQTRLFFCLVFADAIWWCV